jgi:hypothetical protein
MIDPNISTPREDESTEDLAKAWIAFRHAPNHSDEYNMLFWTLERMSYLIDYLPNKAWRVILLIWSLDQSPPVMQVLSAGPVEDLLAKHGDQMIGLVEAEAKRDPSFAKMLGGVWKNAMSDAAAGRLGSPWLGQHPRITTSPTPVPPAAP